MSTSNILPSSRLRLRESHATFIKFKKLNSLVQSLGISISIYGNHMFLQDNDFPNIKFEVLDTDNNEGLSEFPIAFEYKIVYDNPAYIQAQKEIENKARQLREIKAAEEKERILLEKQKRELEEKNRKELAERKLLKELKEKYESSI